MYNLVDTSISCKEVGLIMDTERNNKETACFMHNVLWLRKHYGFSKKEMSGLLNISIKTLNKIENGKLPPRLTVEIVFNIIDRFKISPKSLFEIWVED